MLRENAQPLLYSIMPMDRIIGVAVCQPAAAPTTEAPPSAFESPDKTTRLKGGIFLPTKNRLRWARDVQPTLIDTGYYQVSDFAGLAQSIIRYNWG